MAIIKDVTIAIVNDTATTSENLFFYQGDKGVEVYFDIQDYKAVIKGNIKARASMDLQYANADIRILFPDKTTEKTSKLIIDNNRIKFVMAEKYTKQLGKHILQIHLYDECGCRTTVPPIFYEVKDLIGDDVPEEGNVITCGDNVICGQYVCGAVVGEELASFLQLVTEIEPSKTSLTDDFIKMFGESGRDNRNYKEEDEVKSFLSEDFINKFGGGNNG